MGVYLVLGGCKFHHVIARCIALKLSQHCQLRTDLMVNVKSIRETTGIAFWSVPPPSIFAVMEDWNRLLTGLFCLSLTLLHSTQLLGPFYCACGPFTPWGPNPLGTFPAPRKGPVSSCAIHTCAPALLSPRSTLFTLGILYPPLYTVPAFLRRFSGLPSLSHSHSHSFFRVAPSPCAPTFVLYHKRLSSS